MRREDATAYTSRCFRGEPAPCSFACPFHMDIRSFLDKAGKGRWMAAYKTLRNATVFPVIVAALCDQPCRGCCQRTVLGDEAIAVRDVESAVLRSTKDRRPDAYVIPPKTQRVAVVGAGVAGLSAALNLAQKKYPVTVFEKQEGWGGFCARIPASRISMPTSLCSSPLWRPSSASAPRSGRSTSSRASTPCMSRLEPVAIHSAFWRAGTAGCSRLRIRRSSWEERSPAPPSWRASLRASRCRRPWRCSSRPARPASARRLQQRRMRPLLQARGRGLGAARGGLRPRRLL